MFSGSLCGGGGGGDQGLDGGAQSRDAVPPLDIEYHVRTATAIAVHNFRIAVFCYAQRSSSAEETNRVQTAVCLFSPRFSLGLNVYYSYSTVYVHVLFYKTFSQSFLIFSSF